MWKEGEGGKVKQRIRPNAANKQATTSDNNNSNGKEIANSMKATRASSQPNSQPPLLATTTAFGVPPLGHNVKSAVEKRARAKSNDCQCENKSHSFILAACQIPFSVPVPVPGTLSTLPHTPFLPPLCCAPRTTAAIKTLVQHR